MRQRDRTMRDRVAFDSCAAWLRSTVHCLVAILWCSVSAAAADSAARIENSIGMELRRIPAGDFRMGSAKTDAGARPDEQPQHSVRISKPFYMGVHEVTQGEFQAVMGFNNGFYSNSGPIKDQLAKFDCSRFPVDGITWYQAVEFCLKLSKSAEEQNAGRIYRLPTEAEWEYSCRAGTSSIFNFGDSLSSAQANFNGRYPFGKAEAGVFLNRTTTVGSYKPNAFGLYDMHGNLNEWCMDRFDRSYYSVSESADPQGPESGTARVIRGGDWYSDARDCRSSFRYADIPDGTFYALGFRVVCELRSEGARLDAVIAAAGKADGAKSAHTASATLKGKPSPTAGEDWPRWRGPRADGTWRSPALPNQWPKEGLQQVWRQDIGGGYGGIAVSGGRVYVMDRVKTPKDVERVLCFDAVSGNRIWSHSNKVDYSSVSYDNGPRSTPTVFRGHVYTLGALGRMNCLNAANGEVVWSKDLLRDFGARIPIWGLSTSPLVFEDLLIVHPGAENNGCYIAFELDTGRERWRNLPDAAGYATPILVEHLGTRQLIGWTPAAVRGLEPRTGKLQWTVPFEVNYGTAIADPVFHEGMVLVSSYYEGSKAIRLGTETDEVKVEWQDRRNLRGLMSQPLYRNGHAWLIDKRHGLTCFEFGTGRKLWDDDNRMTPKGRNPQATLVWLNDQDGAIALNSDGELVLVRLNQREYVEESRTKIIGRTWSHPAYAGNCVYARSDTEIVCVLLPEKR